MTCLAVYDRLRSRINPGATVIYDNASQVTLMKRGLLSNYESVSNGFTLGGIIPGSSLVCVGRGMCPHPFQDVVGYHVTNVEENIIADCDIKRSGWKRTPYYDDSDPNNIVDEFRLTRKINGKKEDISFQCINDQYITELSKQEKRHYKTYLSTRYYQELGLTKETIARMVDVQRMHQCTAYLGLQYLYNMLKKNVWQDCHLTSKDVANYAKYMHPRSMHWLHFRKKQHRITSSKAQHYSIHRSG